MKIKILKTEQDYKDACERIYKLIHSDENLTELNSPKGEEMELLSLLIEKYEQEHYPIEAPNPIEAIKFRMDQMNLKQADLAPLFGGKTRISEVINGKRPLSLKMIALLNRYLGIPLESLIVGNKDIQLDSEKRQKLLSVESIKEYVSDSKAALI